MEITRDGCVRIRTSQELIDHEKGFDKELVGSDNSASQCRFTSDCRLLHPPGYSCRMHVPPEGMHSAAHGRLCAGPYNKAQQM